MSTHDPDRTLVRVGFVVALVAIALISWLLLRSDEAGLEPVVTVDAAGDTLVYSGPVRDAIARARIVEAFNSVAVHQPDSTAADSAGPGGAGRAAREAAVDALARLYAESVEPEALISALNLAILDFAPGTTELPTDAGPFIQAAAEVIERAPGDFVLLVTGHADDGPNEEVNRALSLERARAVALALERAGVDEGRLRTQGRGSGRNEGGGRIGEGHVFFELAPPGGEAEPIESGASPGSGEPTDT